MKISFCITCKGRLDHLKQTLPQNIQDNRPKEEGDPQVEFVVLDYNCPQGTMEWIFSDQTIRSDVENGLIKVAKLDVPERDKYHTSHAKNMAHRLATGDIVCNLDADNFLGPGFAKYLMDEFKKKPDIIVGPCPFIGNSVSIEDKGFYGRIALRRDTFFSLGGYDEVKYPYGHGWGGEDSDFLHRARLHGLSYVKIKNIKFLGAISHDNEERVKHFVDPPDIQKKVEQIEHHIGLSRLEGITLRLKVLFNKAYARSGSNFGAGKLKLGAERDEFFLNAVDDGVVNARRSAAGIAKMFLNYAQKKLNKAMFRYGLRKKPEYLN